MISIISPQTHFKAKRDERDGDTEVLACPCAAIINTRKMNIELEMNGISFLTLLFLNISWIRQSLPSPGY